MELEVRKNICCRGRGTQRRGQDICHLCCKVSYLELGICLKEKWDLKSLLLEKRISYMATPLLFGFRRSVHKSFENGKYEEIVCYTPPDDDDRMILSPSQMHDYLLKYKLQMGLDLFCFNPDINIKGTMILRNEFWPKIEVLKDISEGKEMLPIQVLNSIDLDGPPQLKKYVKNNVFPEEININTDDNLKVCCTCVDDCRDKLDCECFRQTLDHFFQEDRKKIGDLNIGYDFKTLPHNRMTLSGIFECNKNCKCKKTCLNRVVQHGTKWWLQVFKTQGKGWGVRTLTDIPANSFVANYCGEIISQSGKTSGGRWIKDVNWMYFIDLEIDSPLLYHCNKNFKKPRPVKSKSSTALKASTSRTANYRSVSVLIKRLEPNKTETHVLNELTTSTKNRPSSPDSGIYGWSSDDNPIPIKENDEIKELSSPPAVDNWLKGIESSSPTSNSEKLISRRKRLASSTTPDKSLKPPRKRRKSSGWLKPTSKVYNQIKPSKVHTEQLKSELEPVITIPKTTTQRSRLTNSLMSPSLMTSVPVTSVTPIKEPFIKGPVIYSTLMGITPKIAPRIFRHQLKFPKENHSLQSSNISTRSSVKKLETKAAKKPDLKEIKDKQKKVEPARLKSAAGKVKGKYTLRCATKRVSYKFNWSIPKTYSSKVSPKSSNEVLSSPVVNEYILDGNDFGNVGRFFNHSCDPNLFCQYVFVDTHDLRFPWVSLFAQRDIRAGEELSWNYHYETEYKTGNTIECKCGADNCTKKFC